MAKELFCVCVMRVYECAPFFFHSEGEDVTNRGMLSVELPWVSVSKAEKTKNKRMINAVMVLFAVAEAVTFYFASSRWLQPRR